jgi:hypothetical protein
MGYYYGLPDTEKLSSKLAYFREDDPCYYYVETTEFGVSGPIRVFEIFREKNKLRALLVFHEKTFVEVHDNLIKSGYEIKPVE